MKRLLAYVLILLLFQSFGRELVVLHFNVNQAELAARYCINKNRPRLHCNGRCYLARQLRRAERGPAKTPTSAWAKVKFEVLEPFRFRLAPPAWTSQRAVRRYATQSANSYTPAALQSVFHPPVLRG